MKAIELTSRLDGLRALLYELIEDIDETGLEGGPEDVAYAAAAFDEFFGHAKDAKGYVETEVVNRIEYTPVPIETAAGTVEVLGGSQRKSWQTDTLGEVVAKRIVESSIDPDTGERLMDTEDMIRELLKYVGVGYWRVGALKSLGLNADNYCESTEGPRRVKITREKR